MNQQSFPQILAVAAVVVNKDNKVLLRKRIKEPGNGMWEIFAGYLEPGERLMEGIRRHLNEKAGITEAGKIEFTGNYYDDPNRHPGTNCIPFVFKVSAEDFKAPAAREVRWFSKDELQGLVMALDNKQMLKDLKLA